MSEVTLSPVGRGAVGTGVGVGWGSDVGADVGVSVGVGWDSGVGAGVEVVDMEMSAVSWATVGRGVDTGWLVDELSHPRVLRIVAASTPTAKA